MRRRRKVTPNTVPPIPDELRGVGIVEQWVDPRRDSLPRVIVNARSGDDARRRYLGDTTTCFAWRREAEHRLDLARDAWVAEHVANTSGEVILSQVRPTPAVVLSAVAIDICERRRWHFGARCEFRDKDAFSGMLSQ